MVRIGASGIEAPALGVGTWAWGDKLMWQYGRGHDKGDVVAAFHASLNAGLRLFDTAEVYGTGTSERLLGELASTVQTPLVIATKFAPLPHRWTAASIRRALHGSLQRLRVDCIDLYQVHWYLPTLRIETLMNVLADAVQEGKIRAIGVSNYSEARMRQAHAILAKRGLALAANQVEYHLLNRECERNGVLSACQELGITLIAYSPLGKGLLSGKYRPGVNISGARRGLRAFAPEQLAAAMPTIDLLTAIGAAHGKTASQVALNWLVRQPGVLPIPGAKNGQQAAENAGALGWEMTAAEADALDQTSRAAFRA